MITGVEQRRGALTILFHGGDRIAENMICSVLLISNTVCQSCAGSKVVGGTFGEAIYTLCLSCWLKDEKYHAHYLSLNVFGETAVSRIESRLLYMPDKPLLNRQEAAALLRISTVTLIDWTKRGLPHYRQRGRIYYTRSEIIEYLKTNFPDRLKFNDLYAGFNSA